MFCRVISCPLSILNNIPIFICNRGLRRVANTQIITNGHEILDNIEHQKLLKVAVIGCPNAGKSTFINTLMDRQVCATSAKVHTTRGKSIAVFTENEAQIVFLDTPGLVSDKEQKRFNLGGRFSRDAKSSLKQADIIGVIHDVANVYTREILDIKIIKLLEYHKTKPSFLVLNKVDALKSKRKMLDIARILSDNCLDGKPIPSGNKITQEGIRGWPYFNDIFMTSALTGDGLQDVRNYLVKNAKPEKWMFPETVWTDQSPESVITNSVNAKLLDFLPQEIPYKLQVELEYFNIDDHGCISTVVIVHCPSARIAKLIAGVGNGKLRQITASVQKDLQHAFRNYVKIQIVLPQNTD